jgi:hypothetical protein
MIEVHIVGLDMNDIKAQVQASFPGTGEPMSLDEVLEGYSLQEAVAALMMKADKDGYDLTLVRKGSPAEQKKAEAKAKLRGELVESLKQVAAEVVETKAEPEEQAAPVAEEPAAEPEKPAKRTKAKKGTNGAAEAEPAPESPADRKNRCLEKMRTMWSSHKKEIEGIAKKFAGGDTRRFVLLPEEAFEGISKELEGIS